MSRLNNKQAGQFENHLDEEQPKWFAVYTQFKREKVAAKFLKQFGILHYLPIQSVTRRYARKVKKLELPLIKQYLFVKITTKEYIKVLQCPYVMNFVKFSNNLISIPQQEINLLKRILGEIQEIELDNILLEKGDEVEVIGGNLTGLKGVLIKKENNQYLSVRLTNIGLSINISIAAHLLRKIKPGVLV